MNGIACPDEDDHSNPRRSSMTTRTTMMAVLVVVNLAIGGVARAGQTWICAISSAVALSLT